LEFDLLGSRDGDVIDHVTIWSTISRFLLVVHLEKSLSPAVFGIIAL